MDNNKIVSYIESSFMHDLILDEQITDISYNGNSIFYMHNTKGRQISDIQISSIDAKDFIRQVANLTEKQFSFQSPILDVTAGKYRLNAVHNSIGRYGEEQSITFSLRVGSEKPRISTKNNYFTKELLCLINQLIKNKISIVIGGTTGSGKTELQKFLLSQMPNATRIIVIDNVLELSQFSHQNTVDFNIWQADDKNISTSLRILVKNALRSNPDWLIIAESRGGEMLEILNSVMTGHPIITTIHALSAEQMPNRIARMIMMNDKKSEYSEVIKDVYLNFPIHIYLKRTIDKQNNVVRYISSIVAFTSNGELYHIYEFKNGKHYYQHFPQELLNLFSDVDDEEFIKTFGGIKN